MKRQEGPEGGQEFDPRAVVLAVRNVAQTAAQWKVGLIVVVAVLVFVLFAGLFVAAGGSAAGGGEGLSCTVTGIDAKGIPSNYRPWLARAAAKYRLGARGSAIVAAIHEVESNFGRSTLPGVHSGTNSAGAAGPGQFLFPTWEAYGVDADGDGRRDIYGIPDSIFATANYLHASGAPGDWHSAIFAYNHAEWYVQEVLETADGFGRETQSFEGGEAVCGSSVSGPLGELPGDPLERIGYVAKWIESKRLHYCWGGGHAAKPGPSSGTYCWSAQGSQVFGAPEEGLDCSGAVRWLLVLDGYPDPGQLVSSQFGTAYPYGPGRHVTIWSNADHVFIAIDGHTWGTSETNFAHGPGFADHTTIGFVPSHPPGL